MYSQITKTSRRTIINRTFPMTGNASSRGICAIFTFVTPFRRGTTLPTGQTISRSTPSLWMMTRQRYLLFRGNLSVELL